MESANLFDTAPAEVSSQNQPNSRDSAPESLDLVIKNDWEDRPYTVDELGKILREMYGEAKELIVPDTVKWMNRLLEPSLTLVKLIMLPQEFVP